MVILRRQRIWVIGIVLASLLIGYAFVRFTTPVYETSTTILIQGSSSGGNNQDPVSNVSLPVPMMSMATQMQILQSPALLSQTYEKINVAPESLDQRKPDVKVSQMGETAMLQLSVQSTDPNLAKQIAEVLPLQFQAYMRDDRQTEVQNSIDFLNDSIREQKALLQADQKNLSEYRRQLDLPLVMGQAGDRSARSISAEDNVDAATTQVMVIQRRMNSLQAEKRKAMAMMTTVQQTENTALREQIKREILGLETDRSVLLQKYQEDHPDVKAMDKRIADKKIELAKVPPMMSVKQNVTNPDIESFDSQIASARVELAAANRQLARAREMKSKSDSKLEQYRDIEPKETELVLAVQNRMAGIQNLENTLKSFELRRNSAKDIVRPMSGTTEPKIVKPNDVQYVAIALLMGCFLALGFAMLKDVVDDKVTDAEEIYGLTGLPALGSVPVLPQRGAPALAMTKPNDRLLEKYRILRFNLLFSTMKEPVRSIMVTSSSPAEGKTELACNLAVAAAGEGRKVILVDANLRYPMIHQKMNVAGKPGLTDVAAGTAKLSECLHPTVIPGLSVLTCGTEISNPAEFLASSGMQNVKAQLDEIADLVIFDSANCLGMADAMVLSSVAESVLFVAKSGTTKRTTILRGLDVLRQANARVLGVAMNGPA